MDALEETILRDAERAADNDDIRTDEVDSGDEDADQGQSSEGTGSFQPPQMNAHNTGVKGVLADYKDAKRLQAERQTKEAREFWDKLKLNSLKREEEEKDELGDLLDDDDFLKEYNNKRLNELRTGGPLPTFGSLDRINEDSFLSVVEDVDKRVTVLVLVIESNDAASTLVLRFMDDLAPRYPSAHFAYTRSAELGSSFDAIALPMLLIYRGGELQGSLTRVADDLGAEPSSKALEDLLYRERALDDSLRAKIM